ncbi:MAG TPA: adenosine deaminase [Actinomycetes bacterium]|nr:adenosine deaminase [Actinomycetes bacterium]
MAGKVELHLHLDCAASYAAVAALAPGISFAEYRAEFVGPPRAGSLADLLRRPRRIVALMQDRRGLRVITEDLFDQLARDGVVYAELRFAPLQHLEGGMGAEEVVAEVERTTAAAAAATGIDARLILCTVRHFSPEQSLRTAELVERFKDGLVAALDIAGDEAGHPLDQHEPAFRYAIEHGLPRTAHAGESAGPASVWETLARLEPSRIGHGARSVEDPALVDHLRERGTHLEVCPSSNVLTSMVSSYREHPVDRLYRAGVSLGISTDVRTMIDTGLGGEYERLRASFGWDDEHFRRCNAAALRAAFAPEEVKRRVASRLGLRHGRP